MTSFLRFKLKPLEDIMKETDLLYEPYTCHYTSELEGWLINTNMQPKFGDNNYYSFEYRANQKYTHRCVEDGCFYHQSWFVIEEKISKEILYFDLEELVC